MEAGLEASPGKLGEAEAEVEVDVQVSAGVRIHAAPLMAREVLCYPFFNRFKVRKGESWRRFFKVARGVRCPEAHRPSKRRYLATPHANTRGWRHS